MRLKINRTELVSIIEQASEGCAERNREKLRRVAQGTPQIAVGWFHCDGVGCPARQARYRHKGFQQRFDEAMFKRFGKDLDEDFAFVVRVVGEA